MWWLDIRELIQGLYLNLQLNKYIKTIWFVYFVIERSFGLFAHRFFARWRWMNIFTENIIEKFQAFSSPVKVHWHFVIIYMKIPLHAETTQNKYLPKW